jgi:hypothetical protein
MKNQEVKTEELYQQVDNYELAQSPNHELTDEELEIIAGGTSAITGGEVSAGASYNTGTNSTTYSATVKLTFGKKK